MPAIVIHKQKAQNEQFEKTFRQLSSSFSMEPNGYIIANLRYLVTPQGLGSSGVINDLLPLPGQRLLDKYYNIRNIPKNVGLYVVACDVKYETGLHFVDIVCSSCVEPKQAVLKTQFTMQSFSGSETYESGANNFITEAWSFQASIPTIIVESCCIIGEENFQNGVSVSVSCQLRNTWGGSVSVMFPWGKQTKGAQYKFDFTNVINRSALLRSSQYFEAKESMSVQTDGSIAKVSKSYVLSLAGGK